jgi:hypothetical protein
MPTPTYDLIASTTLATSSSSVVFSSLPQNYRDLVLVMSVALSPAGDVHLRFNSDTGSNYSMVYAFGFSGGVGSTSETASYLSTTYYGGASTTIGEHAGLVQIMDYSATDKHKPVLSRQNRANSGVDFNAARWANTSAITSILVFHASGRILQAGTTLNLYGIAA